jgi:hypothetical protein
MKRQMIISMKTMVAGMLLVTIFTIPSCNGKQGYSQENKGQVSEFQSGVKPPEVDIHTAAFMGNLKAIQQHIEAGTDLDRKDAYGSSPLMIAATFGKTEVAKALIAAGADLNTTNNDGATPLHSAAFLCRVEIVEALLENGAERNIKNNFGSTPLESVSAPFEEVKGIYDQFSKDLGPLGLKLDYGYIKETRPRIAEMLRDTNNK